MAHGGYNIEAKLSDGGKKLTLAWWGNRWTPQTRKLMNKKEEGKKQ